ncbi:MAG: exodeoxyribonuclease V subunit beta [Thiomargarita sp.]|nr:exodeoxyribonuclease V subunit beta [Thiomargarita sp.]
MIKTLEPLSIPLLGINLIEASAGTGKTYTITTLFIRLILEKKLTIDQILVVTFTEAATEELRDRIRRRLRETLNAFEQGKTEDIILAELVAKYAEREQAIFRLTMALRGFDEAAIFTIHSFCLQMLQNNAFESGVLFDTELLQDQSHLLREIVEDFWRKHFYEASPLFITYILEHRLKHPKDLIRILNNGLYLGQPFLKILPQQIESKSFATEELEFYTALTKTQQTWKMQSEEIKTFMVNNDNLNGNKYRKKSVLAWFQDLDYFLNAPQLSTNLPKNFSKFTTNGLKEGTKKNKPVLQHTFFDQCQQLEECQIKLIEHFATHLLALKSKLFTVAEQDLIRKKQQLHVQSFDDLLINLYKALKGKNAKILSLLIRKKYQAALIDEFQDTDPIQYEIFKTIYNDKNVTLFLIGDPKQAIYSFRGADIFTYMTASRDAKHRYTLATNWRSEANLIDAVNSLFAKALHPFIFAEIPFQPAQAPENNISKPLFKINNQSLPPMQLWFVPRDMAHCKPDKPISKTWAKENLPQTVAYEIVRLLNLAQKNQAMIGDKALEAGDIAVLVRKNSQAIEMQKILTHLHIPSVLYSRESLFHSDEMVEIERILLAIAEPNNETLIKAALTTEIFGISGNKLHEILQNDLAWQKYLNQFQHYHFLWQNVGFIQMFRALLLTEGVSERLLNYPEGERNLTNVLHAAEVLQQATVQQKFKMLSLCQWLAKQRDQQTDASEEEQLRLESDEKRVKIVTIHKSKGLEYPIVFCPFVWDGHLRNTKSEQFTFHDDQNNLVLDLGSSEQYRKRAEEEEKAENLRLFYVAVTRAKHRCYLAWGAFKDANHSAVAHLLHPSLQDVETTDDMTLWQHLHSLATDHPQLQISYLPMESASYQRQQAVPEPLNFPPFLGNININWKVSSFSSLLANAIVNDQPDYDSNSDHSFTPITSQEKSIFSFPKGAKAGSFMHQVFEDLDFQAPDMSLIQTQLTNFGYEVEQWQDVIMGMVNDVLHTPLQPQLSDFNLAAISSKHRLNELEFYYPITQQINPISLQKIFIQFRQFIPDFVMDAFNSLNFTAIKGFMKGYIDMIFEYQGRYYIVDYKSNFLGAHSSDYHHNLINSEMVQANYILQYYIYTIALHRYLSTRLVDYKYEKHIGGIYYLFLRGMNPHTGANYGIYYDKPPAELINALSDYFGKILNSCKI